MEDEGWVYIGDGVYIKIDTMGVWLHANDHRFPTDKIYLEWEVYDNLKKFIGQYQKD